MVLLVINEKWTQARVAERFQVARGTVSKWVARYKAEGAAGLEDRSSRPRRSPNRTSQRTERRIVALRVSRRWGSHRIAYHLRLPQSTVSKVPTRYQVPLLGHIDLNTGVRVRKPKPVRYEHENPGDLVHVDAKKLGRIPDGGGHRTLGRERGNRNRSGVGHLYLHFDHPCPLLVRRTQQLVHIGGLLENGTEDIPVKGRACRRCFLPRDNVQLTPAVDIQRCIGGIRGIGVIEREGLAVKGVADDRVGGSEPNHIQAKRHLGSLSKFGGFR